MEMFIKDVCKECKLTKKAVEYYEEQGLISPAVEDNGYRNYSDDDVAALKEISVLRKLGISVGDIKDILASNNKRAALAKCKYKADLEVEKSLAKKKCLEQLMKDYDIDQTAAYVEDNIEKHFTIKERLLQAFPGVYGMYLCLHFGQFLDGQIDTDEKQEAYNKIIDYLDGIQKIEFPKEVEEYLCQFFEQSEQAMEKLNSAIMEAVNNTDEYLERNKQSIDEYLKYRNSDEFKKTPAYEMRQLLSQFLQENGYYDIFVENMKILSNSYREYFDKLQAANRIFMDKYPQVK